MSWGIRAFGAAMSAAVFVLGFGGAASAEDNCHPLTIIASVDLVPTTDNTWQFVPVTINGSPRLMLLDTGGYVSEITPQAAAEFNLAKRKLGFEQTNVAGESSDEAAMVSSFGLGRLVAKSMEFVVTPEKSLFGDDKDLVGIIGPNILRNYDIDIDFGAHKLNLISPDHCEGKVVYWHADAVDVVPMNVLPSGHIVVPVKLDGQDVLAFLDTGASNSTLQLPVAESDFHLKMGTPDTPYVSELNGRPGAAVYKHRFSSLSFGGIAASNPQFEIIPDLVDHPLENGASLGSHFVDANTRAETAPMLLGMNILRHLHLYIAYKEKKLYITPAGSPTPTAAVGTPGTPAAQH
jgi:predicted aspartyl protease